MTRARIETWIGWLVVVWTLAITVARAIRYPNDFSETQWLLDYRFGFMKRGLVGSICNLASGAGGFSMTPTIIVILSAITAAVLYAALAIVAYRLLRKSGGHGETQLVALVFASSPFIVMSAHLFGYLDAILYSLAIGSAALVFSGRPMGAAVLSGLAILVHESYLLIGFPLVALAMLLAATATPPGARRWRLLIAMPVPVVVFLLLLIAQRYWIDQAVLREQLTAYLGTYDFVSSRAEQVPRWHTTGFFEYLDWQRQYFFRRLREPRLLATLGPALLALLYCLHVAFRIRPFSGRSLLVLLAVLCPLVLHAVAWDTARISSYVVAGAFIALWIHAETRPMRSTGGLVALIAVPALVLNVFSRYPLMDNQEERFADITRFWLYLPALLWAVYVLSTWRGQLAHRDVSEIKKSANHE